MGLLNHNTAGMWYGLPRGEVVSEAVAFVKGSGLELFLETWGMSYYTESIQRTFDVWLQRQKSPG